VYSTEVEEVLSRHPDVLECSVFGVPDPKWGEAVHAVVVPRPGVTLDVDVLISLCREELAGYKLPKHIDVRDEPLPRTAAGKIRKRDLREPFWGAGPRRIHG
jgi:long-chain acyl-CoA synthetase